MNHLIFNWGVKWSVHTRFIKCFFFRSCHRNVQQRKWNAKHATFILKIRITWASYFGFGSHTDHWNEVPGLMGSKQISSHEAMNPWSRVPHMYIWPLQRQLIHHVAFTLISLMLQFTGNAAASEYHPNVQLWVSSTCFVLEETQRAQNAGICLEGFLHFITHMRIRLRFFLCKRFSIISFWEGKV